jgi:hypothetical protein
VKPALWLLLRLRLWGWLRRLFRNARTVRGALLLVLGGLCLLCGVGQAVVAQIVQAFRADHVARPYHEAVERYGPLALLAYFLSTLLFTSGERAVTFTPAEVNLLLSGPFSRRQLLAYKIVAGFLLSLLSAVFMTFVFLPYEGNVLFGYAGLVLILLFVQLFSLAVGLVANTVGVQAYNRRRKVLLVLVLAGAVVAVSYAGRDLFRSSPAEILQQLQQKPAFRAFMEPFRWFVAAFSAERLWPDFLQNAALGLTVNAVLLAVIFALDAQYLETAAVASERLYAQLQRLRTGGTLAMGPGGAGKVRFSVPSFPWWFGVGPVAWRQAVTALRGLRGLLVFFVILGSTMVIPVLVGRGARDTPDVSLGLAATLIGMTLMMPMLPFDFRGDVDRMEVLKTLPLGPGRIVLGQLLVPVFLLSLVQLAILLIVQAQWGGVEMALAAAVAFAAPVNFLSFGVENLLFLWFPTRSLPTAPGDLQLLGRHMLLWLGKLSTLGVTAGVASLLGLIVYLLTGQNWWAALGVAWVTVVGVAAGLVPLLALAFRRFDVARDTPP